MHRAIRFRRSPSTPVAVVLAALAALGLILSACGSDATSATDPTTTAAGSKSAADQGHKLVGLFKVTAPDCTAGAATSGSYFRMVQASGTVAGGPFIANADSTCGDKTYSPLIPGTTGGLITGAYQPQPANPFDTAKNGVADAIVQPTKFFAVGFALSTNKKDPASGAAVPAPEIVVDAAGRLTGQTTAVNAAWNGQQFNQGSPKPDGSLPGISEAVSGTYDGKTGAYTLEWASEIVGGPFNGFTGVWHLEGTFVEQ